MICLFVFDQIIILGIFLDYLDTFLCRYDFTGLLVTTDTTITVSLPSGLAFEAQSRVSQPVASYNHGSVSDNS
jgi:hypothetical protein